MAEPGVRVAFEGFSGTLPELLAAAEGGSVDAAALPLSDLLAQVRAQPADLEAEAGMFVALAQLVELKARALLPQPPPPPDAPDPLSEEEAAAALAERLAAYQAFAEAAAALRAFEQRRGEQFGRPTASVPAARPAASAEGPPADAAPGGGAATGSRGAADLERLLAVFAEVWERARPRTREVARERYSVGEAAAALRRRLSQAGEAEFADLFTPAADRLEVVVTFLALLEMVRQGEVSVRQDGPFAALRIAWNQPRGRGRGRGTPADGR